MKLGQDRVKWLKKNAKQGGGQGTVGTIAFYGPDATRASKMVASVIPEGSEDPSVMIKRFDDVGDVRVDRAVLEEVADLFKAHAVRRVAMMEEIIGCPHEEGPDYPLGQSCLKCPYWAGRDRWTGAMVH
jgi:hypothetical protein